MENETSETNYHPLPTTHYPPKKYRAIAIYGGSFDPPHLGHLAVMSKALETLDIDKLIVVPAYLSPFKKGHRAPAALRVRWLKKVAAMDPRIEVSDIEAVKEGPSYTVDTVTRFLPEADTIYLIIGADNLAHLKEWHRFDDLNRMVRWVVATRDDTPVPEGFLRLDVDVPVSSTRLRKRIDPKWIPEPIREEVVKFYKSSKEKD
ncbi:nicotinate (nicotinamide) nucleotide adenylyltransferase [Hydrogenimonas sp. SS33]|uniref:nicotinate (nicotinamide) nucleotide adenylyltransferase n=1 Tax=Hydrogenimonas leucolamina TaxID=2954236 RepID=UPI00336BE603